MKKVLALVLVLIMALSIVACGSNNNAVVSDSETVADSDTVNSESESTEPELKVLTMATNAEFPPYEFYDGEKVVGIDAEVAAAIADKLGMKLEIIDTAFDSIIPAVQSGKYDIGMAGMTVTDERLQEVSFSDTYAKGVQVVIVAADSEIKTVDDLFADKKYTVGVQNGTTADIYLSDDLEGAGLGTLSRFNKGADAVEALKIGKVDAVVIDNEPAKAFVASNEGLQILESAYADEDYAIAVAKENTELLGQINAALAELKGDGTFDEIVGKYIKAE